LVLFILAVIWAAVLLPPYLQNRSASRPADSISSFQRQLSVLERRAGTSTAGPVPSRSSAAAVPARGSLVGPVRMSRAGARKRRRDVLFTLMAAAVLTFPLAVIMGGPVWGLQLLCDLMLVGFVVLLIQSQQRMADRETKVSYLPGRQARAPEPALALRRSGS
jgi:hypothetical protein